MADSDGTLDITPSPNVLVALTQNPMPWHDAIFELIDNSIDSFAAAARAGSPVKKPEIELFIPMAREVRAGHGAIVVRDNGIGLDEEGLQNALRAGFSTKTRVSTLGLFGLGFNISTGKIGTTTTVITAQANEDFALQATIDLPKLIESDTFDIPLEQVPKPDGLSQGTIVEVSDWWPAGHQNHDFPLNIAQASQRVVLEHLGRTYATLLKGEAQAAKINILVYPSPDDEPDVVTPFEHCVWGQDRSTTGGKLGEVPAQIHFDETIGATRRCIIDWVEIPEKAVKCPECGGTAIQTVEEKVRGWVGIQRFDDENRYGIDVIRNGRAILVEAKEPFFYRLNAGGTTVKEYPRDDHTGRIVGEIHLDHCPVDFLKQRFEISAEWQRAMEHVRGGSLLPGQWTDDYLNKSPISRLHDAYKRIRNFGRKDMYMGTWDPQRKKGRRISRAIERDYFEKFELKVPGYYDDTEWWKLVEQADTPPPVATLECQHCNYRNPIGSEVCEGCEQALIVQTCPNPDCGKQIPRSAKVCEFCGNEVGVPALEWQCVYCEHSNQPGEAACSLCTLVAGAPHPTSAEALTPISSRQDELSRSGRTIRLANGNTSTAIDVEVWSISPGYELKPTYDGYTVPLVREMESPGKMKVFVDQYHEVFVQYQVTPYELVATEVAQTLYALNENLRGRPGHTHSALVSQVLAEFYGEDLTDDYDSVHAKILQLFEDFAERFAPLEETNNFYEDMTSRQQQEIAQRINNANQLKDMPSLIESGHYLRHLPPDGFPRFFNQYPDVWLEHVFNVELASAELVGDEEALRDRATKLGQLHRCLGDCAALIEAPPTSEPSITHRASSAFDLLDSKLQN